MATQLHIIDPNLSGASHGNFLNIGVLESLGTSKYMTFNDICSGKGDLTNPSNISPGSFSSKKYLQSGLLDFKTINNNIITLCENSGANIEELAIFSYSSTPSKLLTDKIPLVTYPLRYPTPVDFINFNPGTLANGTSNNYVKGVVQVENKNDGPSSTPYKLTFGNNSYYYANNSNWKNSQIAIMPSNSYFYLANELTLRFNYYGWSLSDTISFNIVFYLFTNTLHPTTGFPCSSPSMYNSGTSTGYNGYKYIKYNIKSVTLSNSNSYVKITESDITNNITLKDYCNVYFAIRDANDDYFSGSKGNFEYWANYLFNSDNSLYSNFIAKQVCTANTSINNYHSVLNNDDFYPFINTPVIIKGRKSQESYGSTDLICLYSIGFIGLENVTYNIGTTNPVWSSPLPGAAILYYKYVDVGPHAYTAPHGFSPDISNTTLSNSYYMINGNESQKYVVNFDNYHDSSVILTSYSYTYSYYGGGY